MFYFQFSSHHSQGYNNCTSFNNQLNWFDCKIDLKLCIFKSKRNDQDIFLRIKAIFTHFKSNIFDIELFIFHEEATILLQIIPKYLLLWFETVPGQFSTFAQWTQWTQCSDDVERPSIDAEFRERHNLKEYWIETKVWQTTRRIAFSMILFYKTNAHAHFFHRLFAKWQRQ